jgi:TolA-binding protein
MRPLFRSLFLLSLAAAPLAFAASPAPAPTASKAAATASSSPAAEPSSDDAALVRSQVQDLESTLNGVRREFAQIREQEDARGRVIGDPNDHPLWP